MSVSVVVPSYNHAPFVERTLRSIFKQTRAPKKLIVIDDGSKDESAEIIERTLNDCPFEFEFVPRENRGLSATLNQGFEKTRGEYFAYLGSDDVWLPTFLEKRIELLENRPRAVLAFGHAFVINENDFIVDRTDNWTPFADGDMLPLLLGGEIFSSPSVVYRRAALEKLGKEVWNEDALLEDYELYLKLALAGEFALDANLLCAWRRHGANTSDNLLKMVGEMIAAQNRLAGKLKLTRSEVERAQTRLKFKQTFELIRRGEKGEAARALGENWRGAESFGQIARAVLRLAVPRGLFSWNVKRKRRGAIEKYGKLNF